MTQSARDSLLSLAPAIAVVSSLASVAQAGVATETAVATRT